VPAAGRRTLQRLVADAPSDPLPIQLVHGDFRSSNILCGPSAIAAVIDFEDARLDHCLDEIARSAVMLGTRFRDWGPVSADVRATFLAGYESVRPLTPVEQGWWDILVLRYALTPVPPGDDPTGWGPSALSRRRRAFSAKGTSHSGGKS
jgi:homoserine kinase type II